MNRPRIAILGVFGVGNFGNEATLTAYLTLLRSNQPDAQVTCICAGPERVESEHGIPTATMDSAPADIARPRVFGRLTRLPVIAEPVRWLRTLAFIRRYDSLIIPGTGILDDFGTTPDGLPYHLFRWCLAARLCRVRVQFIGIGAGPIVNKCSRRLMAWAARLAHRRSFRDQESKAFAGSLGVPTGSDAVIPDLVFCLPHTSLPNQVRADGRRIRVALGVMAYFGWGGEEARGGPIFEAYIKTMANFTRWLLDNGHEVGLVVGELADHRAADALLQALARVAPANLLTRVTATPQSSMNDFLDNVQSIDVAVVTRFHNVIGALMRGKPVISVGYASKNDRLMEDFGLQPFCQHIKDLSLPRLIAQFEELVSRRVELSAQITVRAESHRNFLVDHLPTVD